MPPMGRRTWDLKQKTRTWDAASPLSSCLTLHSFVYPLWVSSVKGSESSFLRNGCEDQKGSWWWQVQKAMELWELFLLLLHSSGAGVSGGWGDRKCLKVTDWWIIIENLIIFWPPQFTLSNNVNTKTWQTMNTREMNVILELLLFYLQNSFSYLQWH